MAECTEAERELIEAALEAVCEMDRLRSAESSLQRAQNLHGVAWCGSSPHLPESLRAACIKVAVERFTPERKEALRNVFIKERELLREKAALEAGIPGSVWPELVNEIYPKGEPA